MSATKRKSKMTTTATGKRYDREELLAELDRLGDDAARLKGAVSMAAYRLADRKDNYTNNRLKDASGTAAAVGDSLLAVRMWLMAGTTPLDLDQRLERGEA